MVRFKNRWFLVEFLFPSSQPVPAHTLALNPTADPLNTSAPESSYIPPPPSRKKRNKGHRPSSSAAGPSSRSPSASSDDDDSAEDSDEDPNDVEVHWPSLGPLPLLLPPPPNAVTGKPKKLDERAIYQALRTSVVQVFGDDGWGRAGGGTSVKYYSAQTSLCIVRTSRDHHRTVWSALSMLGPVNGEKVVARVVHCSGTIKKIQLATIAYNRTLVSTVLASTTTSAPPTPAVTPASAAPVPSSKKRPLAEEVDAEPTVKLAVPEGEGGWKGWEEREQKVVEGLTD